MSIILHFTAHTNEKQRENVFIYENKYYRQIKGGVMGSSFTVTEIF